MAQVRELAAREGSAAKAATALALLHASPAVRQQGPSCGVVGAALGAAVVRRRTAADGDGAAAIDADAVALLACAREKGWSREGEAFDASQLAQCATDVFPDIQVECVVKPLHEDDVVALLAGGAVVLVAYDADKDHTPRQTRGANAHWALVVGCVGSDLGEPDVAEPGLVVPLPFLRVSELCVLVRHGKTTHLGLWPFSRLAASNAQLSDGSTIDRERYVVPADLREHLANRYITMRRR